MLLLLKHSRCCNAASSLSGAAQLWTVAQLSLPDSRLFTSGHTDFNGTARAPLHARASLKRFSWERDWEVGSLLTTEKPANGHDLRHLLAVRQWERTGRCRSFSTTQEAARQAYIEAWNGGGTGISVLNLNRGAAKNALGAQMMKDLAACLEQLRSDATTRCLLVRSCVSGVFCAGADLKERATLSGQETAAFVSLLRATFSALATLPMPTIAAVEGVALGGGAELALACDIRVAARDCKLGFPETRLGVLPGAGGTQRLPRLIGSAKAKELIFTGRTVSGAEAHSLGLVEVLAESGAAFDTATALATRIAQGAPLAVRMAKKAITHGAELDLVAGLKIEEACYAQLLTTSDRLEGLKAFAEKRPPQYTGR